MRGKRPRNLDREKSVAQQQARYLQMHGDEGVNELLRLIDAKGGDYYRRDLFPDTAVVSQADSDFNSYRMGTPAMEEIANDMRNYYGLTPQAKAVAVEAPVKAKAVAVEATPAPKDGPMQGPAEPQKFKDKAVETVKKLVPQEIDRRKAEYVGQLALAVGGGALAGAGINQMMQPNLNELDQHAQALIALESAGLI